MMRLFQYAVFAVAIIVHAVASDQPSMQSSLSPSHDPSSVCGVLDLHVGYTGWETSWEIQDMVTNQVVVSGSGGYSGYNSYTNHDIEFCLPFSDRCYEFVMKDFYGDGMDGGNYRVILNGNVVIESDGDIGYEESTMLYCPSHPSAQPSLSQQPSYSERPSSQPSFSERPSVQPSTSPTTGALTDGNIRTAVADYRNGGDGYGPIKDWDTSRVTDMNRLFLYYHSFNADISQWDVSKVSDMRYMFHDAPSFNSDISQWDVGNVRDMYAMFHSATSFNADISQWDVSSVEDMSYMFAYATLFNSDLNQWDVSSVGTMSGMFYDAISFNQKLCWDVYAGTDGMFGNSPGILLTYPTCLTPTDISCTYSQVEFSLTIQLDDYPQEVSWELKDGSDIVFQRHRGFYRSDKHKSATITQSVCVDPWKCYTLTLMDFAGDGICCDYGNGFYRASLGGHNVASGGNYGSSESSNIGSCTTENPTSVPSHYSSSSPSDTRSTTYRNEVIIVVPILIGSILIILVIYLMIRHKRQERIAHLTIAGLIDAGTPKRSNTTENASTSQTTQIGSLLER